MKRIHAPFKEKKHWRSLNQLSDSPEHREFLENEFPHGITAPPEGMNRKKFLSLMGASLAMAGLTACRRPVEKIIPYAVAPEDIVPGIPKHYATAMPFGIGAMGVIAESHEGRPTKLDGNPVHSGTMGAANVWLQAEILNLYDPDRSKFVTHQGKPMKWNDFTANWAMQRMEFMESQGAGLAVLSGMFNSPSLSRLQAEFVQQFPKAQWVGYAPVSDENIWTGHQIAAGEMLQPVVQLKQAKVILSLDSDFLRTETNDIYNSIGFAAGRKVHSTSDDMNRLYVAESGFSLTGAMADHRFQVRSHEIEFIAQTLAGVLIKMGLRLPGIDAEQLQQPPERIPEWMNPLADDLMTHAENSVILAGRNQPPSVHALVYALNDALKANGRTIQYYQTTQAQLSSTPKMRSLADRIQNDEIQTLLVLDNNILYHGFSDLNFDHLISKVPQVIHWGPEVDETAQKAHWHVPAAHFLESWGDVSSLDGTASIIQPLIDPLFGGKTMTEMLAAMVTGTDSNAYGLVRETWRGILPADSFEPMWRKILHDGIFTIDNHQPVDIPANGQSVNKLLRSGIQNYGHSENSLEIVFRCSPSVYDGRYANNGWLQENPDPITKLTWDNAAVMSRQTARKLNLKDEDLISITLNNESVTLPVLIQPGHADCSISLELGYGRTNSGRVGNNVGRNVYPLRSLDNPHFMMGAVIKGTGKKYALAGTQDHHGMDVEKLAAGAIQSRMPMIIRESTLADYRKNPEFASERVEHPPLESLWEEHSYDEGYQWGMAVDLNLCTGCSACTIACQSENNIPIVGRDEVRKGREMHWMRMDRYYVGDPDHPEAAFMPMACQHCENAPCEGVCPVAATVHDEEGLNAMVYNRCIGTRYCSNNCPYKVRRFNFFNYTKELPEIVQMAMNPDVTVRFRGVMEKCTYCVQRINRSKIEARNSRKPVDDGAFLTACEQSCPTGAIVFGNINDPESRVTRLKAENRNYALLAELNIQPRTSYLAKLRNPNPALMHTDNHKVKSNDH